MQARIRLDHAWPDGSTLRTHLKSVWRQTGVRPAELAEPAVPEHGRYLLGWFWRLADTRQFNDGIPLPIGHGEMQAFFALAGIVPLAWEIEAIRIVDAAALAQMRIERNRRRNVM